MDIDGYRELNPTEIDQINELKALGALIGAAVVQLETGLPDVDRRWVSIGNTHLQQGIMCLVRSIAKPTGF